MQPFPACQIWAFSASNHPSKLRLPCRSASNRPSFSGTTTRLCKGHARQELMVMETQAARKGEATVTWRTSASLAGTEPGSTQEPGPGARQQGPAPGPRHATHRPKWIASPSRSGQVLGAQKVHNIARDYPAFSGRPGHAMQIAAARSAKQDVGETSSTQHNMQMKRRPPDKNATSSGVSARAEVTQAGIRGIGSGSPRGVSRTNVMREPYPTAALSSRK